jgi:hypothetical protein
VVWVKVSVLSAVLVPVAVVAAVETVPSRVGGVTSDGETAVTVSAALSAELAGRCPVVRTSPPPDEQAASAPNAATPNRSATAADAWAPKTVARVGFLKLGFLVPLRFSTLLLFIAFLLPSMLMAFLR